MGFTCQTLIVWSIGIGKQKPLTPSQMKYAEKCVFYAPAKKDN